MTLAQNTRLGRYEIRSKIGAGGMGDVYVAFDTLLERQVAIKVFPPEFGREAERLARFVREAKAASALNHPGILTVFDTGRQSGMYFIVTELVEGMTLREWVSQDHPSLAQLVDAVRQAALALGAAHRAGIVHRDIKPENLMRRRDGLVKVLDFGIAKMIPSGDGNRASEQEIPLTAAGSLVGTVRYMSPEQASGEPVDGRTDIWSLGVVFYELATGRAPFGKGSVIATVVDITSREPLPLSTLLPEIPEALVQVVERALRKNPNDRFPSAALMAEALEQAIGALKHGGDPSVRTLHTSGRETVVETVRKPDPHGLDSAEEAQGLRGTTTNIGRRRFKLIGRDRELSDVMSELLSQDGSHLVTITGPGGTGKTRLAIEAAYQMQRDPRFSDGVYFVDLSSLSEPISIADAIARAIDVVQPHGNDSALRRELADKRMLLVLDNFEHLLEGATLVSELLESAPGLKVLATSRAPLRLSEEREYPLEPLEIPTLMSLPPLDELARIPAVALFVERAKLVQPAFELNKDNSRAVVEVCRKLEGLPLALELAAARVKLLTPAAMLGRLDDRLRLLTGGARDLPERQQTMRGAVAWSYELLEEHERAAMRRLSVFAGGCTLDAAEVVCGSDGVDVLEALASLIDNSLLKQRGQESGELRFTMLEVVREYAAEKLEESGESEPIGLAFAGYFKRVVEDADAEIRSGKQVAAVRRLSREQENITAALAILLDKNPQEGASFTGSVQSFWTAQGYSDLERRSWLLRALAAKDLPPTLRARLLNGLTRCEVHLRRPEEAVKYGREAVQEARASGDRYILSIALGGFGHALSVSNEPAAARKAFEESAEIARERGSAHSLSVALGCIGEVARIMGDLEAAKDYYEQALDAAGRDSRSNPTGIILANLGGVSLEQENYSAASDYYRRSLSIVAELENLLWASVAINGLAAVALHDGKAEKAATLAGAAEVLCEIGGSPLEKWEQSLRDRYVAELRSKLDPKSIEREWALGQSMSLKDAAAYALTD
jgi:non-specific serine/threonine protein kinase